MDPLESHSTVCDCLSVKKPALQSKLWFTTVGIYCDLFHHGNGPLLTISSPFFVAKHFYSIHVMESYQCLSFTFDYHGDICEVVDISLHLPALSF